MEVGDITRWLPMLFHSTDGRSLDQLEFPFLGLGNLTPKVMVDLVHSTGWCPDSVRCWSE